MPSVILVFAKAPTPGRVKTRLEPVLNPIECAELHHSFTQDVLDHVAGFSALDAVQLYTDEPTTAWPSFSGQRLQQRGSNLGEKMWNAASDAFCSGFTQVLILGTDSPTLPATHLLALLASPADIAFGPCEDGGYYAVMFRRLPAGLFDGVAWSTDETLEQSIGAARRLGLSVALGPRWYDIDSPADLARLVADDVPPHTRAWLESHHFLVNPA